jgi:hypothetical protein
MFFLQVFQTHVLSVSSIFMRMLQIFHLGVSNIDPVLLLRPTLGCWGAAERA